jgi:hypothetical protein
MSKLKRMTLDVKKFQVWKSEERVMYAYDGTRKVVLYCYLNGNMTVEKNGKIIWKGMQPFSAVEEFNNA